MLTGFLLGTLRRFWRFAGAEVHDPENLKIASRLGAVRLLV
jgi:hypothetical protein